MKTNFTRCIKKLFTLPAFIITHATAWAAETNNNVHGERGIFEQPWPWILIIVAAIILLAGPFDYKEEFTVTMKKKNRGKKI